MRLRKWMGLDNLLDMCEFMKNLIRSEMKRTLPQQEGNFFEKFLFEQQHALGGSR